MALSTPQGMSRPFHYLCWDEPFMLRLFLSSVLWLPSFVGQLSQVECDGTQHQLVSGVFETPQSETGDFKSTLQPSKAHLDLLPVQLHTTSDGQKFEVRGDSLHASRSFKYFGQGQGVSAYTFVNERNFLWHSLMISAADLESAYVIDGLMHNDVVKSYIHSTDTHGYTEAVFGLTHMLGFSFVPRIKSIGKQTLSIFKPKNQAGDAWAVKPDKTINETVIRENC
jgi:hypothetical protein